jgi:hypothetical protein
VAGRRKRRTNTDNPAGAEAVAALFERARGGDEAALNAFVEALQDPVVRETYGNVALHARWALLGQIAGADPATRGAVVCKMTELQFQLAGPNPTVLEALAADRAVTAWLHVHALEMRYGDGSGLPPADAAHHQRCLSRANGRYLAALKALAVVRRLAVPPSTGDAGGRSVPAIGAA